MRRPLGQLEREVERWRGAPRPSRIDVAGPGQESVWDYPRPPRVEPVPETVRVELAGVVLAESGAALRVLETAAPPTYYVPALDVRADLLVPTPREAFCEWKGRAGYWHVEAGGRRSEHAAWSYADPFEEYAELAGAFAFFAGRVDACRLGAERVVPQPGGFYGGWITWRIVGPFKGEPGSEGW